MPTEYEVFEVNGNEIKLSNPGKVHFPQSGGTKGDLARYHVECADAILNHVRRVAVLADEALREHGLVGFPRTSRARSDT